MNLRRTEKIASLIYNELSRLIFEEISDPDLQAITLSTVRMTGDLKQAQVFYQQREGMNYRKVELAFRRAIPFFKRKLANLELRYVPELSFRQDNHLVAVTRILEILERERR